ncbi:MAG: hypothetical protein JW940_24770 [Polyangiaceae bacterium]|nr:hypothetical protein [Polyangiaceae bacterium]
MPGLYMPPDLAAHVQERLRAVGDADWSCSYSDASHKVTIAKGAGTARLLRSSGENRDLSAWTLLGFESGEDLEGILFYEAETPLFSDPDKQHSLRVDAQGARDDQIGSITGTAAALITRPADVVRFLVSSVARRPELIDEASFDEAGSAERLGLFIQEPTNLRDVLDRIEHSCGIDIVFDGDGRLYFMAASEVVDLYDRDFLSFSMERVPRDLYRQVVLEYGEDPSTGTVKARTAENASIPWRFGRTDSRTFRTYLVDPEDAAARIAALSSLAASTPRLAHCEVKGKLADARIGTRVTVTRRRGIGGSLEGVPFHVLSIEKEPLGAAARATLLEV